jgi:hypothetical protein
MICNKYIITTHRYQSQAHGYRHGSLQYLCPALMFVARLNTLKVSCGLIEYVIESPLTCSFIIVHWYVSRTLLIDETRVCCLPNDS